MLGFLRNRSSRSLSALADDSDLAVEQSKFTYRSASLGFHSTNPFYQASLQGNGNGSIASSSVFDPFVTASASLSGPAVAALSTNPYSHDTAAALGGATFFANQTGFQQPVG